MAKSKSGGTRTYIRGRVGSDVYSVGRDGKGKKQQVVRSLAESVSNPQTQAQMKGRMIMSTISQVVAALRPIIDHSFDDVVGSRANLAEFTSRNYALIKADVAAHPSTGNKFGLNSYQERGAKRGQFVISDGQATIPTALVLTKSSGIIAITLPADNVTIGGLKSALNMTTEEYFTLVGIKDNGEAAYERFRVNPTLADTTAIAAGNIGDVFAIEGNAVASIAIASNVISITLASVATCCAVIVSKKVSGKYIHNEAVLGDGTGFAAPADTALPTYPVGAQNYLNGGDIFGQSESFNPGEEPSPTPSPTQSAISGATINGASLAQSGSAQLTDQSNAVVVSISAGSDGASYGVAIVDATAAVIGQSVAAGNQTAVAGSSVNLSIVGNAEHNTKKIVLCRANVITQVWGTLTQPDAPQPSGSASLTALTGNGLSWLDPTESRSVANNYVDLTFTGENLSGAVLAFANDINLQVGNTLNLSGLAEGLKHTLNANSGSVHVNGYEGNDDYRGYLVVDGSIVQRLSRLYWNDEGGDAE